METQIGRRKPPYAILSHTWEDEEVTLQDWNSPARDGMKGFQKILRTCQLAASDGIKYAWVDTCCIDKSNSAELSEAINSMYRWYREAKVCFAYLSDLHIYSSAPESTPGPKMISLLRKCRWFARGWTLQELIAPKSVRFYQHNWGFVGKKADWCDMLSSVTGISSEAIRNFYPEDYSIAERMSWAAKRETTREEDKAYCLMGIFDINMPMLYGEGPKAFRRLQEEIIRTGYDVSIFAWTRPAPNILLRRPAEDQHFGAFANAPGDFVSIPAVKLARSQGNDVSITNAGVKLTLELCLVSSIGQNGALSRSYVLPIRDGGRGVKGQYALGVALKKTYPGRFARTNIDNLVRIPRPRMVRRIRCPGACIVTDVPLMMSTNLVHENFNPFKFLFPQKGCRIVKVWPSDKWNDAEDSFMTSCDREEYGSLLVEVKIPTPAGDDSGRSGEFMFLFSSRLHYDDTPVNPCDLQYTIVGYREHQLVLDTINLRMGTGDIDVQEMRRTLVNFAIPRQQTAVVPVNESGQYIYASVERGSTADDADETIEDTFDMDPGPKYIFRWAERFGFTSPPVACENEQQPWNV
ncbi:Vegetative incompatibility protein HET-E-1 [Colletotrichum sp. SAR 10_86]|nr:Vegetative incompatibility protein HET-E-1 [Colletotrichum sp. SAR 10_86]